MTILLLDLISNLAAAAAGLAFGLTAVIMVAYWRVYRATRKEETRLLPMHIMLIGASDMMLAIIAVLRLGNPPPPPPGALGEYWVYPFISLAFIIKDVALVIILIFISRRGPRYKAEQRGQNH